MLVTMGREVRRERFFTSRTSSLSFSFTAPAKHTCISALRISCLLDCSFAMGFGVMGLDGDVVVMLEFRRVEDLDFGPWVFPLSVTFLIYGEMMKLYSPPLG